MSPLPPPETFPGVLDLENPKSLDFSQDLGSPGPWPRLALQTLLPPHFINLQMCWALSLIYVFSQYLWKTYYASDGSPWGHDGEQGGCLPWLHGACSLVIFLTPCSSLYSESPPFLSAHPSARQTPVDTHLQPTLQLAETPDP